jgi:hypothetical protein
MWKQFEEVITSSIKLGLHTPRRSMERMGQTNQLSNPPPVVTRLATGTLKNSTPIIRCKA